MLKRNRDRRTPGSVQPTENKENEDFEIKFIDKSIGKGVFTKRHISGGELLMEYRGDLRKTKTWDSENVVFVYFFTHQQESYWFHWTRRMPQTMTHNRRSWREVLPLSVDSVPSLNDSDVYRQPSVLERSVPFPTNTEDDDGDYGASLTHQHVFRVLVDRLAQVEVEGFVVDFEAGWLRRTLLTEAYRCEEPWLDRLRSPVLSQVNINEFSVQVLDKLNKQRHVSVIDMDILANKLHEIEGKDDEIMVEEILAKFRKTPDAYPVNDSINHAIIRSYIQRGKTDLLLPLLRDKQKYGVFLDPQSACILMDYYIQKQDYSGAAKVGYEVMLQDDFSHRTSFLLTLYSCVKHLFNSEQLPRWEPAFVDPEEEVTYEVVDYISIPYYDDHFDITHDRLLLGKALYNIGKKLDSVVGRSLQLIGLGLWEKFSKANNLLEKWLGEEKDEALVTDVALQSYSDCLSGTLTRDPDAPEKGQGEITMDDQIMKLRLTPQEKEDCTAVFQNLQGKLKETNRISDENIVTAVEDLVKSELPKHESGDIDTLKSNYETWDKTRTELLDNQMRKFLVKQKEEEILKKFIELQEKEQLLTFFEKENELELMGDKVLDDTGKQLRRVEEEYVEAPGERDVRKTIKKKKK